MSKKEDLVKQAKDLADPQSTSSLMRRIGELESQLAVSEAERKFHAAKVAQAQEDLRNFKEKWELLVDSQDKVTAKKLSIRLKQAPRNATGVLCLNDWHAEQSIDPLTLEGNNEFNLEICCKRLERVWQKGLYLLEFVRTVSKIDELVVWLGGDLINGTIHEELEESNFLGPGEATLWVQERICEGLDLILREGKVNRILVVTNYGNHGRTTRKKRHGTGFTHSWEWLAYTNLERMWRSEPAIAWKIERGYFNSVDIQGRKVRFHHGDNIRYAGGVGGVAIPLRKAISQWNKLQRADLDVLGHFHQYADDWYFVLCGCLCGYDSYAQSIKGEFQPPTQTFLLIDKEHGKVMALPIFCGLPD